MAKIDNQTVGGKELLALLKQNAGKPARHLAALAGYTTTTRTGQQRVKMLAFQKAVLEANQITFEAPPTSNEMRQSGRKAAHRMRVQANGNLLIGSAYTREMGLEPGTIFEIQPGRKHLKLVLVESSDQEQQLSAAE